MCKKKIPYLEKKLNLEIKFETRLTFYIKIKNHLNCTHKFISKLKNQYQVYFFIYGKKNKYKSKCIKFTKFET